MTRLKVKNVTKTWDLRRMQPLLLFLNWHGTASHVSGPSGSAFTKKLDSPSKRTQDADIHASSSWIENRFTGGQFCSIFSCLFFSKYSSFLRNFLCGSLVLCTLAWVFADTPWESRVFQSAKGNSHQAHFTTAFLYGAQLRCVGANTAAWSKTLVHSCSQKCVRCEDFLNRSIKSLPNVTKCHLEPGAFFFHQGNGPPFRIWTFPYKFCLGALFSSS